MSMVVRRLGSRDVSVAQRLIVRFHHSKVTTAYLHEVLTNRRNVLLAALDGEEVVGFLWGHWLARLRAEQDQLFVYEIEVAEERRRQGIGTRLIQVVLDEAASRDAEVFLLTNHSNEVAVAFYESLGGEEKTGDDLVFFFPPGDGSESYRVSHASDGVAERRRVGDDDESDLDGS
jgi:ribosomal protein S18 acetylase RimI-like enzyme